MSDDEEIVLKDSELHKYMQINISNQHKDFEDQILSTEHVIKSFSLNEQNYNINESHLYSKCKVSTSAGNIISIVIKTGLLYPDHINELDNIIDIINIKEAKITTKTVICWSCLAASSSAFVVLYKQLKMLQFIGLTAASYFGYKLYTVVKACYDVNKIRQFTTAIENLFATTKRTLSFILESEFLLRSKIVKDQPFYVPSNGWVNPNTKEGLTYSGLIVTELRRSLLSVYLDVVIIFDQIFRFMKNTTLLKTDISSALPFMEPLDNYYDVKNENKLIPNSEDLKKLNNLYLILQSECLKHFILCFVEELWVNKSSHRSLNIIIVEVVKHTDRFSKHTQELESKYQKCINELKDNGPMLRVSSILKSGNDSDKLYSFINNFLTKADAHILSMLLDLRMIKDWISEFEENNKDNDCNYSSKLITTLHDRLQLMKGNIQSFTNLYNDNCNILERMTCTTSENTSDNNLNSPDQLNNCTRLTNIEVGKSNFDFTGADEVLISLSHNDNVNEMTDTYGAYYEDQMLQKCLPKNVLDELKFALKDKREEWLEREKKATLNSTIGIDNLDFDNLLNSNVNNHKKVETSSDSFSHKQSCLNQSTDSDMCICNNSKCPSDEEEECLFAQCNTITDTLCSAESVKQESDSFGAWNIKENVLLNTDNSDGKSIEDDCSINSFNIRNTFADQIKFAQKSFNLRMTEEEFIEGSSEEEES